MALKPVVAKIEDVDEKYRPLYKPGTGGFVLDFEGADDLGRLGEFRNNNIELRKQQEALAAQLKSFEGIDPEAVKSLREQQDKAKAEEEKELIRKGKFDELVARRTAAARADLDSQIKATRTTLEEREKTITALQGRLSVLVVDSDVAKAIEAVGLKPRAGALDDIHRRARDVWKVDDSGNMVAVDPSKGGKSPLYSAEKAGEPITMKEYVAKVLAVQAAHLFEGSSGGGAAGGARGGGGAAGQMIEGGNALDFGRNLEGIAKGTVRVRLEGAPSS